MSSQSRLDALLLERGLLPSRQAAQAAIMDGGVLVDGRKVTKPGTAVSTDAQLELVGDWQGTRYVSRGGLKLERALQVFAIEASDRICLDIGASTGGFTDCLLQHGARLVYAIDVGYGQLEWKLRQDPKVVVKERVNARYLSFAQLYGTSKDVATLAVVDVSFISLAKILPACKQLLAEQADVVALVKPQFEAGRQQVGKGGVVREPHIHAQVLQNVIAEASELQLQAAGLTYSPLKGPAGNREFLLHLVKGTSVEQAIDIDGIVKEAHENLS